MNSIAISIVVAMLGALLGSGIAALAISRSKKNRRHQMVAAISGRYQEPVDKKAKQAAEDLSAKGDIAAKLKKLAREQKTQHDTKSISSLLLQCGFDATVARFWVFSLIFGTLVFIVCYLMKFSYGITGLITFSAYFGMPRWFLKFKAGRRQKAFLDEFADALEAMIRLLKAGMPVTEAIAMVSREFTGPVGEEMSRIYDAQKVGLPLGEAVRKMGPRMPIPEVQMFATAIAIQQQTGSSLSEVLGNLAGVIRARHRLKRKVQALSSEAKVSAMIIGALPVVVTLALWAVNPEYIGLLFDHPTGKMLLFGAIVWMSFGVLSMKMMINFKV